MSPDDSPQAKPARRARASVRGTAPLAPPTTPPHRNGTGVSANGAAHVNGHAPTAPGAPPTADKGKSDAATATAPMPTPAAALPPIPGATIYIPPGQTPPAAPTPISTPTPSLPAAAPPPLLQSIAPPAPLSPAPQAVAATGEIWTGLLDIESDGYGFLRNRRSGYLPGSDDVYVSLQLIRRNGLRQGDMILGRVASRGEPGRAARRYLVAVEEVNGVLAADAPKRPRFEDLTPIFPNRQIKLERSSDVLAPRLIDLIAPIGFGQRALLVAPPKAGKTTVMKEIAAGVIANHPEAHVMAVLVGERPEEVTDFADTVDCEVLASTFDEPVQEHVGVAEMAQVTMCVSTSSRCPSMPTGSVTCSCPSTTK